MAKKKDKARWRKEGNRWVATIPNSRENALKADRHARWEANKERGIVGLGGGVGSGAHGGNERQQRRRKRHQDRLALKRGEFND